MDDFRGKQREPGNPGNIRHVFADGPDEFLNIGIDPFIDQSLPTKSSGKTDYHRIRKRNVIIRGNNAFPSGTLPKMLLPVLYNQYLLTADKIPRMFSQNLFQQDTQEKHIKNKRNASYDCYYAIGMNK